jgi:hypothetical protein
MSSFDTINYSLRPNKAIQRQIVFDGLDLLDRHLPIRGGVYIGMGSLWFSDFILAHKRLGIAEMISIESDPLGAIRGRFNAPFNTVLVEEGDSTPVLRDLAKRDSLLSKQWIVWLDYDRGLSETPLSDIRIVIDNAPPNSVLILTLDAGGLGMGRAKREEYVRGLLGDAVSDDANPEDFEVGRFAATLAASLLDHVASEAANLGRPGGFVPMFNIPYKDSSPMITVGGVLPSPAAAGAARACLSDPSWPGAPTIPVEAPPLTLKEVTALQRLLPAGKVSRAKLRRLGFDLEDEQLATYVEHYRRYPSFLQVVA